jgi:transcriptional regulator GlxA family with amidase domain
MKQVCILVPFGHTSLSNIEGAQQILTEVNNLLTSRGCEPLFNIKLVGLSREVSQRNGLYTVKTDLLIQEVTKADLVIVPSLHGDQLVARELNKELIPWIQQQYANGAEIACFCIGSFFLAATGLLKGRKCATHWIMADEFRAMFPEVNMVPDKILTDEDGIYTSGGAYSFLNLLVYLIEKYAGRELAILICKAFAIDIDRDSQAIFRVFKGQKAHADEQVRKAQEYIERHFQDKITVDRLADMLALSRRSLERRFKKATSNTVSEYIQRVKMEAAKKDFEHSRKTINEVMYQVGYCDTKAFRTIFRKVTGLSPLAYRNKYNKEMVAV